MDELWVPWVGRLIPNVVCRVREEMGEAEGSEAIRMEEVGVTGGTQSSAMEVDEEGEDEVVVVERVKQGETRKQAPSSPPKSSRKRSEQGQ